MATNVTEKDKTLREVIAYCDQAIEDEHKLLRLCTRENDTDEEIWRYGRNSAYLMVRKHCESMLGYGGTMPDEVPNQSEDARQEDTDA